MPPPASDHPTAPLCAPPPPHTPIRPEARIVRSMGVARRGAVAQEHGRLLGGKGIPQPICCNHHTINRWGRKPRRMHSLGSHPLANGLGGGILHGIPTLPGYPESGSARCAPEPFPSSFPRTGTDEVGDHDPVRLFCLRAHPFRASCEGGRRASLVPRRHGAEPWGPLWRGRRTPAGASWQGGRGQTGRPHKAPHQKSPSTRPSARPTAKINFEIFLILF